MTVTRPAPSRSSTRGGQVSTPPAGRRTPKYVVGGVTFMLAFALLFVVTALRADPAMPVLAVAEPVAAGQTITSDHLRVVRVVPDSGMQVIPESDLSSVIGRTAAVPLAPGSLLTPGQLGSPQWPPAGESVIAISVAGGRVPAGLVAGSSVTVLAAANAGAGMDGSSGAPVAVAASVVEVAPRDVAGATVVSLLLASADARLLASADGAVSIVLDSPAG